MEINLKDYYDTFKKKFPILSDKEQKKLLRRIRRGDREAYHLFINSNMRLVFSRVLRFCAGDDPRAMDLVSEGTLGLMQAIERFDYRRNYRFSTYAVWWIECMIRKAIKFFQKERRATLGNLKRKFDAASHILSAADSRAPSDESVVAYLKWPPSVLDLLKKHRKKDALILHSEIIVSLAESSEEPPDAEPVRADLRQAIDKLLAKLTPIEENIVRGHYGIGCQEETYTSIAAFYGLAKERIRQIENTALRKLFVLLREKDIPVELFKSPDGDDEEESLEATPPPE